MAAGSAHRYRASGERGASGEIFTCFSFATNWSSCDCILDTYAQQSLPQLHPHARTNDPRGFSLRSRMTSALIPSQSKTAPDSKMPSATTESLTTRCIRWAELYCSVQGNHYECSC